MFNFGLTLPRGSLIASIAHNCRKLLKYNVISNAEVIELFLDVLIATCILSLDTLSRRPPNDLLRETQKFKQSKSRTDRDSRSCSGAYYYAR